MINISRSLYCAIFVLFVTVFAASTSKAQDVQVKNLMTDLLLHPEYSSLNGYRTFNHQGSTGEFVRIQNSKPLFGWEIASSRSNVMQRAYQVLVASSADSLNNDKGDVWDSGRIESSESTTVSYNGEPLKPNQRYYWKVKVWDNQNQESGWSSFSQFLMDADLVEYSTSRYPLQKTDQHPQQLRRQANTYRGDFGKASFAQIRVTLESKNTNDTVTIHLGEAAHPDGSINKNPGGTIRYRAYQLPLKQGTHTYNLIFTPDKRNTGRQAVLMPDYIGEVFPFRYLEIEGYQGEISKEDIVRATVTYPFNDYASEFRSSDSILNAIWDLCKYSIKATSFTGIYVDGDRERIPYEADAYINQLAHYGVDKEYSMARHSHEYLIKNATWPTEWILQSVLMAYTDYLYTGDIRSVEHNYEDLKAKLLMQLEEANGLISTKTGKQTKSLLNSIHFNGKELRDIVDWPHTGILGLGTGEGGETDGFVFTDYNAVVNAYYYKALLDMSVLAKAVGNEEDHRFLSDKASNVKKVFQRLFWDKTRRVYRDGIDTDHASLHSNMFALAFGLVNPQDKQSVLEFIESRGMACSVYGSQFLMDAIYEAGEEDYGLALLTSQAERSWYNMIREGSTITMEAWGNKFKPNQDWNHAWGAVPANIIPRKLMGVEPLLPGWSRIKIQPQIGSLEHAYIKVPTIKGDVTVDCTQHDKQLAIKIEVPANTQTQVVLPLKERKYTVEVNGIKVKGKKVNNTLVLPDVPSGSHSIVMKFTN